MDYEFMGGKRSDYGAIEQVRRRKEEGDEIRSWTCKDLSRVRGKKVYCLRAQTCHDPYYLDDVSLDLPWS